MVTEVLLMRRNLVAVLFWRLMQPSQQSILSYSLLFIYQPACDGLNAEMNLDDILKNETLMFGV